MAWFRFNMSVAMLRNMWGFVVDRHVVDWLVMDWWIVNRFVMWHFMMDRLMVLY